jgi:hypothetical protein
MIIIKILVENYLLLSRREFIFHNLKILALMNLIIITILLYKKIIKK